MQSQRLFINQRRVMQHEGRDIVAMGLHLGLQPLQVAPAQQAHAASFGHSHAGSADHHQPPGQFRMLGGQQTGSHAAKGKTDQIADRTRIGIAQQLPDAIGQGLQHGVHIHAPGHAIGFAKTRQIGQPQAVARLGQRLNHAQPMRPATAAAMQQHQRQAALRHPGRGLPAMPDHRAAVGSFSKPGLHALRRGLQPGNRRWHVDTQLLRDLLQRTGCFNRRCHHCATASMARP